MGNPTERKLLRRLQKKNEGILNTVGVRFSETTAYIRSTKRKLQAIKHQIKIEEEQLRIEEERLKIEEEQLKIEQERLKIEEERLKIEEEQLKIEEDQLEKDMNDLHEKLINLESKRNLSNVSEETLSKEMDAEYKEVEAKRFKNVEETLSSDTAALPKADSTHSTLDQSINVENIEVDQ